MALPTYAEMAKHYGLDVCENEPGCMLSPSTHKRGDATTWRGNVLHWYMDRRTTTPGMVNFMRAAGKILAPPITTYTNGVEPPVDRHTKWVFSYAAPAACMWAQLELRNTWGVTLPATAFAREKRNLEWYLRADRTYGVKAPNELYATPLAQWAKSAKEK